MKKKSSKILFILILCLKINLIYSQITITDINPAIIEVYNRPKPYDSSFTWQSLNKFSDYKKYIGLKLYLPPFENPKINDSYSEDGGFIFSNKPNIINIDKSNKNLLVGYQGKDRYMSFDKIATLVYKPYHFNTGENGFFVSITNNKEVGNNYFEILDIMYGEDFEKFKIKTSEMFDLIRKSQDKILISNIYHNHLNNDNNPVFILRNIVTKDTVLTSQNRRFVIVPHFNYLKNKYEGRKLKLDDKIADHKKRDKIFFDQRYELIDETDSGIKQKRYNKVIVKNGSNWFCKEVTLIKPNYEPSLILTNDSNEQIILTSLDDFILLDEYNEREKNKKIKADELALKKALEDKKNKQIENERFFNYKLQCIKKYGNELGELIANNKVKIGMTMEMCKEAWGNPYNKNKTTVKDLEYEIWDYGYGYSLHFTNNKLYLITE